MRPRSTFASKAEGVIKYGRPDKGLFRVENVLFFQGMKDGKPQHTPIPNKHGEYWICNGVELIEYDRENKACNVHVLPKDMQGQGIFTSSLPFVFNLNAEDLKTRYWILLEQSPAPGVTMLVAWPKRQEGRSQYKKIQIALNADFEPIMLRLFAPNYDPKISPNFDHYEFNDVKRDKIVASIATFFNNFIPERPPADWKITRDELPSPVAQAEQLNGQTR